MVGSLVLFDANIWHSRTLTDWVILLHLESDAKQEPAFYPQWTEDILAEARHNLRKRNPIHSSNALDQRFDYIHEVLRDYKISNFEIRTPDQFLVRVFNAHPEACLAVAIKQQKYWMSKEGRNSSSTVNLPVQLQRADCPEFATIVRQLLLHIEILCPVPPDVCDRRKNAVV
ncbi:hypothetical protein [Corynebacterium cystitidis]|uniref:hypothetical protein n=1 Tax=Corynebacterium cystitidis TaxID=35757 RepID=UPI00211E3C3E|nr:hypothetical protein [Corynebacterium cystitidis]